MKENIINIPQKYDRWQLRGGYDFKVTEEFILSPFIRYDLSYRKNLKAQVIMVYQKIIKKFELEPAFPIKLSLL